MAPSTKIQWHCESCGASGDVPSSPDASVRELLARLLTAHSCPKRGEIPDGRRPAR